MGFLKKSVGNTEYVSITDVFSRKVVRNTKYISVTDVFLLELSFVCAGNIEEPH